MSILSSKYVYTLLLFVCVVSAWDPDQLEVFDVVEEIDKNFYELMNITQDADNTAIKKAFRSLSLVLHPDKNNAPDADVQFRNLVAVYDVLKDANKRMHYDEVLRTGLPNWRSAVYYYRHYRKMGLTEMIVILFILITIGQYLVGWASYLEKKYTHEQVYGAKLKKQQKKLSRKGQGVPADIVELFQVPPPSVVDTLPVQIPRLIWATITSLPDAIIFIKQVFQTHLEERMKKQEPSSSEEEQDEMLREKTVRKRKPGFVVLERDESELPPRVEHKVQNGTESAQPVISGGLWTDDDLAELVRLVKRYPGGTSERWEKIAETMCRSVPEVTYMAAKLKENCYRLPNQDEEEDTNLPVEEEQVKKQKTKGGKIPAPANVDVLAEWTQMQQKALEMALAKFPKGPSDRWEKIAKCVPNKSKEECMIRYKYLVELLKKKKETIEEVTQ